MKLKNLALFVLFISLSFSGFSQYRFRFVNKADSTEKLFPIKETQHLKLWTVNGIVYADEVLGIRMDNLIIWNEDGRRAVPLADILKIKRKHGVRETPPPPPEYYCDHPRFAIGLDVAVTSMHVMSDWHYMSSPPVREAPKSPAPPTDPDFGPAIIVVAAVALIVLPIIIIHEAKHRVNFRKWELVAVDFKKIPAAN